VTGERLRFRKSDRILRRADFLRVQSTGHKVQTRSFVIMVLPAEQARFGITVTRRTAGAVGRNRIKRLVREVYRTNRALFPERCELVLVARAAATRLDYAALRAELDAAGSQLRRAAKAAPRPAREPSA
jgi:ribonuclease P protein component